MKEINLRKYYPHYAQDMMVEVPDEVSQQNNVKYYFIQKALKFLLEKGAVTQEEFERASRYNAESLHLDREYIR